MKPQLSKLACLCSEEARKEQDHSKCSNICQHCKHVFEELACSDPSEKVEDWQKEVGKLYNTMNGLPSLIDFIKQLLKDQRENMFNSYPMNTWKMELIRGERERIIKIIKENEVSCGGPNMEKTLIQAILSDNVPKNEAK